MKRRSTGVLLVLFLSSLILLLTQQANHDSVVDIRVFVASSLSDVIEDLADEWTSGSETSIELVVGGSNHLAAQLRDGAPADAFLTADGNLLTDLRTQGLLSHALVESVAHNYLVVAQPISGPDRHPSNLYDPSLVLVACAPGVPCGDATNARFANLPVDSHEPSARAVVARLALDEADLGVVYSTDVVGHPDLIQAWPQEATCPCVAYAAAGLSPTGDMFVTFLSSTQAQQILSTHGFTLEPS
ncbi:MAG: substrate-binding domain-containing protein [Acidimicrobiales bacterium]|nr:substrate-binding domain-containing protein [Acidimicrobiales bacterium]